MVVAIRNYETTDKESVIYLFRLNTPKYFSREEEKELVRFLENELETYLVLESDGKAVACGGINFKTDKTVAMLSWDIVHPGFHGRSLGSALLNHRISLIERLPSIRVIKVRTSQLAYKFYEKHGFQLLEKLENFWGKGFDLYTMERKVLIQ